MLEYCAEADLDFTDKAWESLYDVVDDPYFLEQDAQLIYDALRRRLRWVSFGDYLKRYIYRKAQLEGAYTEIPLEEYQSIICDSFKDNAVPASFQETTAKLSAMAKKWLTQQTVKRSVVFLLGFGLRMSAEDVNQFLTKALREPEINPKEAFEVICWYCFRRGYGYPKYQELWEKYQKLFPELEDSAFTDEEYTLGFRDTMYGIRDERSLWAYLSRLKLSGRLSRFSRTARQQFDRLYDETRDLVAELFNQDLASGRAGKRVYSRQDIAAGDIEQVISAAIPKDRNGNLVPSKASDLSGQFAGKRFSRQRVGEILSGRAEASRFDLITLNFFIFSQKLDAFPGTKQRYAAFLDSTNRILENCFMGRLYIQNPYECFLLMCILSEAPLSTYADVWELSFH